MQKGHDDGPPGQSDGEFQLSAEERELGELLDRLMMDNLTSPLRRHTTDLKEQLENEVREQMRVMFNRLMNELERTIRQGQQGVAEELEALRRQLHDENRELAHRLSGLEKNIIEQHAVVQFMLKQLESALERQGKDRVSFEGVIMARSARARVMPSRLQRKLTGSMRKFADNQRIWFGMLLLTNLLIFTAIFFHIP